MEQRLQNASSPVTVFVPARRLSASQQVDPAPRTDGHSPTTLNCKAPSTAADSPYVAKQNFLSKTSVLYILCTCNLIGAFSYFGFYEQGSISREHYNELKVNLRPPWMIFRWLGSNGVDVTDLQWYYFVVALPPAAPYLLAFLFISRRLRRYIASRPVIESSAALNPVASNSTDDPSPSSAVGCTGAVKARVLSSPTPFGSTNNGSSSNQGALTADVVSKDELSAEPSSAVVAVNESSGAQRAPSPSVLPPARRNTGPLHIFHICSGTFIALCISGPGFLFGLILISLNFVCIAPLYKKFSFRSCMAIMWVSHIAILFLNYHAGGYKFAWVGLGFLDGLWTPLIRWTVQYNMSILRMISFNNDLWESVLCGEERRLKCMQKHRRTCIACAEIRDQNKHAASTLPQEAVSCYKCRTEFCRTVPEFTFAAYLGYMFYLPLFMAGPLASFNSYVSYIQYPQRSFSNGAIRRYGLRWLGHAVVLATLMHFIHITAMLVTPTAPRAADGTVALAGTATTTASKAVEALMGAVTGSPITSTTTLAPGPPVFTLMTLTQKSSLFFLVLTFLWAKFDVIWRFFRFFALLDGFDPPEDMPRCFANAVNIQSFWRDWHASFNQWIVRYMYIPMGGSRTKFFSIFPIFFFIALWHDIEMRLLYWALFICIGFIPEIIITSFFSSKTNKLVVGIKRHWKLWMFMRVFGAQLCLMELCLVNLVGFAIGASGTKAGLRQLFSEISTISMFYTPSLFFCGAVLAIQDRDQKAYEAAQLKIKYNLQ